MSAAALPAGCTFPEYGFSDPVGSGGTQPITGGDSGTGGETGGATDGGSGGLITGGGSGGATGGAGGSGGDSPGGVGGTPPAPTCDDGESNGEETGVDCGGPDCFSCPNRQGCTTNSDCGSQRCHLDGICEPGLAVRCRCTENCDHTALAVSKMEFRFDNLSADPIPLEGITLRYYYNEPTLEVDATCAASDLPGGCDEIMEEVRQLTPARTGASHVLELPFSDVHGEIASGSSQLVTYIEIRDLNGADVRQREHYSFYERTTSDPNTPANFVECSRITLHRSNGQPGGVLVWGTPPPTVAD